MLDLAAAFAPDYGEARDKFQEAAEARQLHVERHVHPTARGAQDEALSIDAALLGNPSAAHLLFVTSAMHGVEGFCGSGCQVALLQDAFIDAEVQRGKTAILLCHGVNPYGFSHLRRTNEENVDLNRNFRDFAEPLARNDEYAEIHSTIVPDAWPPTPENSAQLGAYVARFGVRALQAALSRGQSDFSNGLFYTGRAPAWSNAVLRDLLKRYGRTRRRLAWIDIHTGLGPWAHGEKIHLGPDDSRMLARTRAWYGSDVTTVYDGTATSAELSGVCYHAAQDACPDAEYTGITLEYGTRPLADVLQALRGEQWLANHPDAGEPLHRAIKQTMRAAFHDDSAAWQAMAYAQARVAVLQALRAMAA
jgi:predicted deacylase